MRSRITLILYCIISTVSIYPQNYLFINDTTLCINTDFKVEIYLTNKVEIIAFQFDIILPDGIEYKYIYEKSIRLQNHEVAVNKVDNKIKVICFSMNNESISDSSGSVLLLRLYTKYKTGIFPIIISEAILSDKNSQNVLDSVKNAEITVSGTSSLSGENKSTEDFSLSAFPNPTNNEMIIQYHTRGRDAASIKIYNSIGELVYDEKIFAAAEGINNLRLNLKKFTSGVYYMSLKSNEFIETKKFLIIK